MKEGQRKILQMLEKELQMVPIGHFQTQWLAMGMAVFGIPFGLIFGLVLDNFAFFGIGLPIGMTIGIGVGNSKDAQALEQGRQLNFKIGG